MIRLKRPNKKTKVEVEDEIKVKSEVEVGPRCKEQRANIYLIAYHRAALTIGMASFNSVFQQN